MAVEIFFIVASFLVGAAVYREYFYLRFRRPGLRVHVADVVERLDGCETVVTIRNEGKEIEHDVQVSLLAMAASTVVVRTETQSPRPKRIVSAEHFVDGSDLDAGTFLLWVNRLAPGEAIVATIESDAALESLEVRAIAGDESDSYSLPDGGGYGDFIAT